MPLRLGTLVGLSLLGGGLNSAASFGQNVYNNRFNATQAAINRAFQSQESSNARAWQENMSNTQYQRTIADMQQAGVNPSLALSSGSLVNVGATSAATSGSQAIASPRVGGIDFGLQNISTALMFAYAKANPERFGYSFKSMISRLERA